MAEIPPSASPPTPPPAKADELRGHLSASPRQSAYTPRYTRLVRSLRIVVPVVGLLSIGGVVLWPTIRAELNRPTRTSQEERQAKMVNGRYVGSDSHGRPYTITYESAQQPPDGGAVDMLDPTAELTLQNGHWVAVSAAHGRYDQAGGMLDLSGHVEVFHDDGYRFTTERAHVEFAKNVISGDHAITGSGPKGEVEGRAFRIVNNGESIVFSGAARLVLRPDAARMTEPGGKKQ